MKKRKDREPLENTNIDINYGLNESEVLDRQKKGYINSVKIGTSKSYFSIFFGNIFTFFNMLCFGIFIWLITVIEDINGVKNLTFMVIITANIIIGVVQELRAKWTMDKLSLLSSPDVKVLRSGAEQSIKLNEILLDDILLLKNGAQVCSDAIITEGDVEVNEALLTGESQAIKKRVGDTLLSGSFIVSGECRARVEHVGLDNYIQKLAVDAKQFKKTDSELLRSLKLIMKIIAIIILPIAIAGFLTNFNNALVIIAEENGIAVSHALFGALGSLRDFTSSQIYSAYKIAVTPTSASMIGMIPAGLFLLTSVALAVGVIKLAKNKALVQELYSIETLARVDMLCLDKTGTITDGTMSVREVHTFKYDLDSIKNIVSSMQFALKDSNQTADALCNYFGKVEIYEANKVVPFSSDRKCSAVMLNGKCYVLGAPEYVTNSISSDMQSMIDEYAKGGFRCLLLAENEKGITGENEIPLGNTPIALIVIEDNIKEDATEIISYFKQNGVDVRVISGDNPITVSEVARRVGINNSEKYISLHNMSDEEIEKIAMEYTVFGRVNPHQKRLLVQIFKKNNHTVAMTGDGINDILALKEANCSIAMANGSEATRNVAQIVLLDSNFASMPKIVGEGRRVVNNIERASSLFLSKTAFSMVFQLILICMGIALPLEPIQLSFISFFVIGVPSFFLALEPNNRLIEGKFILNIAKRVIPGSLAVVVNVMLVMVFTELTGLVNIPSEQLNTVVMISMYLTFDVILYKVCLPFNRNRAILFTGMTTLAMLCIICMPFMNGFFNLFMLVSITDITAIFMIMSFLFISIIVIQVMSYVMNKFKYKDNKLYFDVDFKKVFKNFWRNNSEKNN